MNCESGEEPKNSLTATMTGRILIRLCGVILSSSSCAWMAILSRTTLSILARPILN